MEKLKMLNEYLKDISSFRYKVSKNMLTDVKCVKVEVNGDEYEVDCITIEVYYFENIDVYIQLEFRCDSYDSTYLHGLSFVSPIEKNVITYETI